MSADKQGSRFIINRSFEVYIEGDETFRTRVRRCLAPLNFLTFPDFFQASKPKDGVYFYIAGVDFEDAGCLQPIVQLYTSLTDANCRKIVFSLHDERVSQEQILLSVEIGARYTCHGTTRDEDLRAYVKRIVLESNESGSAAYFEVEIAKAMAESNGKALHVLSERIVQEGSESEEFFRLLAIVNEGLQRPKKAEFYLKRILAVNPQNLWAANTLAKTYLRSARAADGIEILEKLSHFQQLNGDRFLELGNAYLNCEATEEAEGSFQQGLQLTGGKDARFHEGLAKIRLLAGNVAAASAMLGRSEFSYEVVSFLNTRAILAMRTKRYDEGLKLYETALRGCGVDPVITAKLKYNQGLGLVKADRLSAALPCFEESVHLGGRKFDKAQKTLGVVKSILKKKADGTLQTDQTQWDDIDWEVIEGRAS